MSPKMQRLNLHANALFSALSGLGFLLAAGSVARWSGVADERWLIALGAGLLAFAAHLVWAGRRGATRAEQLYFLASDLGWISLSLLLVLVYPEALSAQGRVALSLLAIPVTAFATLQAVSVSRPPVLEGGSL